MGVGEGQPVHESDPGERVKAGIVIDDWKQPIFERHLKEGGYECTAEPGLMEGTLLLVVITERIAELAAACKAANDEAARSKLS